MLLCLDVALTGGHVRDQYFRGWYTKWRVHEPLPRTFDTELRFTKVMVLWPHVVLNQETKDFRHRPESNQSIHQHQTKLSSNTRVVLWPQFCVSSFSSTRAVDLEKKKVSVTFSPCPLWRLPTRRRQRKYVVKEMRKGRRQKTERSVAFLFLLPFLPELFTSFAVEVKMSERKEEGEEKTWTTKGWWGRGWEN